MGFLSDLFGDEKKRDESIQRAKKESDKGYKQLGKEQSEGYDRVRDYYRQMSTEHTNAYRDAYQTSINDYSRLSQEQEFQYDQGMAGAMERYSSDGERIGADFGQQSDANIGAFTSGRANMESQFRSNYAQSAGLMQDAETQFGQGMTDAYNEYATGRTNTLESIRRATDSSVRRRSASNATTGLSGTSFGQDSLSSIEDAGQLQQGVVQEQYASGLSSFVQQRASGLASMMTNRASQGTAYAGMLAQMMGDTTSGISAMEAAKTQGRTSLATQYSGNIADMGMARQSALSNMRQSRVSNTMNLQGGLEQNVFQSRIQGLGGVMNFEQNKLNALGGFETARLTGQAAYNQQAINNIGSGFNLGSMLVTSAVGAGMGLATGGLSSAMGIAGGAAKPK